MSENLGLGLRTNQRIEPRHQPRLVPRGVVLVDDALDGGTIERTHRIADRQSGSLSVPLSNQSLRGPNVRPGSRPENTILLPSTFRYSRALLC